MTAMPFEHDVDLRRTLPELDPACFDGADASDDVAAVARRVGRKPLRKYSPADLLAVVRLGVAPAHTVPPAVALLDADPLLEAAEHPGDLLTAVLELDSRFWLERHELWTAMAGVLERALGEITARAEKMQEEDAGECWLPALLGDDFMGAVLHFRGMFRE